jgi:uncharacterized protein HemX
MVQPNQQPGSDHPSIVKGKSPRNAILAVGAVAAIVIAAIGFYYQLKQTNEVAEEASCSARNGSRLPSIRRYRLTTTSTRSSTARLRLRRSRKPPRARHRLSLRTLQPNFQLQRDARRSRLRVSGTIRPPIARLRRRRRRKTSTIHRSSGPV